MFPMNCLYQYLHRQEAKKLAKLNKKTKNHLYKLYLSHKLPGYWLQQLVFLKIYFLLPLQCFNWRCYSFAFLLTDRSINSKVLREFKEIIIFKTKNRSFIIFTMYNLLDNSKGARPLKNFEYGCGCYHCFSQPPMLQVSAISHLQFRSGFKG